MRSTSDVQDSTPEAQRRRRTRKQRPYKSDPFTGVGKLPAGRIGVNGRLLIRSTRKKILNMKYKNIVYMYLFKLQLFEVISSKRFEKISFYRSNKI